jgi:hypothetical protein
MLENVLERVKINEGDVRKRTTGGCRLPSSLLPGLGARRCASGLRRPPSYAI